MFDITKNWPFTDRHLTETINEIPNQYGYVGELGWAPGEPVATTAVEIARTSEGIRVLPQVERGGPSSTKGAPTEDSIFLRIPSFPQIHTITPVDVQDWLAKSQLPYRPKTMEQSLAERLQNLRWDHDLTLEYQRVTGVQGIIKDGAGKTLLNLFDAFDIVQKVVDFDLDNTSANITAKIDEVISHVRANALGEVFNGIEILVAKDFFNALIAHPNVEKFYLGWIAAQALATPEYTKYGRVFEFHGVTFREYDATVTLHSGSSVPLIPAGEGYASPVGTRDAFKTYFGPPHDIRQANAAGLEVFVSQELLKHGAGIELKTESCPLAVFKRPAMLVKCTRT